MKKLLILAVMLAASLSVSAQIEGKYVEGQFVNSNAYYTTTQTFPIDISGDNYAWGLWSAWRGTSKITTSSIVAQVSPDGIRWDNTATAKTLSTTDTLAHFTGTDLTSKYLRFKLTVTAGDTIRYLRCWYEFKRK